MDRLRKCALNFNKLCDKDYYFIIENGKIIKLCIRKEQFYHLIGLNKLKDIRKVKKDNKNSAIGIFNKILNKKIQYSDIEKSEYFKDIKYRIKNFKDINDMIFEKIVIKFDKSKVISSRPPKIRSDIIFYRKKGHAFLHLCLSRDRSYYYPETFLVQYDDLYVKNQKIHNIIELKICKRRESIAIEHRVYAQDEVFQETAASKE
ncbi:PBECR4 domain-containing protein [Clostridiisalibacter paucivorans]|uniref:PBECR4 domain-containing protein n=1 Tax=Clostridiisalibacter paucivorans TaxID=408753 RepID=UPI00047E015B|nr:PBECR4 domain-containing protein [Clostridiisalibacter paucivorans]